MSSWIDRLAGKGRRGGNGVLVQIAREVVGRRRSIQGAISEVRHPAVLDALSDDDFTTLNELIDERVKSDREFAQVLARLTHAAAHAKGFDRQTVEAALQLDLMLPAEDPAREREKLLRDAYRAAQRIGYVQGGRRALARLGQRAVSGGDAERGRVLLQQQLDLGSESSDTSDEVDASIVLGDILRRDGDAQTSLELYRRAGRAASRLGYDRGVTDAYIRQIDATRESVDAETLVAMQEAAFQAASTLGDETIQSMLVVDLAETLIALDRLDPAVDHLEHGIALARDTGDMDLENRCLALLSRVEELIGAANPPPVERTPAASQYVAPPSQRETPAPVPRAASARSVSSPAEQSLDDGSALLAEERFDDALSAFQSAATAARDAEDVLLEERAYGGLGVTYSQLGKPVEALNHLMQALEIARSQNDVRHEAQWLASIGEALWKFGQADDAVQAIHQGSAAAERIQDDELHASMLSLLGQIYLSTGETEKARDHYEGALELQRRSGQQVDEVSTLSALGAIEMNANRLNEAVRYYEAALQTAAHTNQRASAVRIYGRLARLAQRQGNTEGSLDALEQAVELAETTGQAPLLGQALQHLAVAQDAAGDPASLDTYERALVLARQTRDDYGEALMLTNVGVRLDAMGQKREAREILNHAISLSRALGPPGEPLVRRAESLLAPTGESGGSRFSSAVRERRRPTREQRPSQSSESIRAQSTSIASMPVDQYGDTHLSPFR